MKRIALSLLALTLVVSGAFAQDTNKGKGGKTRSETGFYGKGGKMKYGKDFKALNLSKDQQDKIASINKDFKAGVQDLKSKEASTTVADFKTQRQALAKKRNDQVQAVLTPDQKNQLAQMRSDRAKKGAAMGEQREQKMKQALNLTDEQSAKINGFRKTTKEKVDGIRGNNTLSDDQKKAQVMAAFKQQREDIKSVLTADQIKKMESMPKPNRRGSSR